MNVKLRDKNVMIHVFRYQRLPQFFQLIREHIKSYSTRHSHYSRKDNSEHVHLSAEPSIPRLYHEFLEKHDPEYLQLKEENQQHIMRHETVALSLQLLGGIHVFLVY